MSRVSWFSIIGISLVVVIAFGSYFVVQTITENNVRQALLDQQKARQIDSTAHIADQIATDIRGTVKSLELLASQPSLQLGDFTSQETTALLKEAHDEIHGFIVIHNIGILDENNIHVNNSVEEARRAIGLDRSDQIYVIETRKRMEPFVSPAFTNALGDFVITVSAPIISEETGAYLGMLVTAFPTNEFFDSYGTYQSSKIVAFDRNQVYVATTIPEFLGLEYWGEQVQTASRANPQLNAAYRTVFAGEPTSTIFVSAVTGDERFVSGSPVLYRGEQVMSVAITTPTASIFDQVEQVLSAQKIQTITMLVAVVAAVSVLIIYLSKWNLSLDRKIRLRTSELEAANEKLKDNDKLQREFINVAAHELRTPIQPMLGVVELIEGSLNGGDMVQVKRDEIEMLARNANRLEKLSSQLLEMARIEGGALALKLEPVDVSSEVHHVIANAQSTLQKDIDIIFREPDKPSTVQADKTKLFEVLANIIGNAIKFTEHGSIIINVEQSRDGEEVIVKIVDTGSGIDPEIMPRLFTKFASKSDAGTGIGLYIAKKIIEAHGGRIWAENNPDGSGATFSFTLPLIANASQTHLTLDAHTQR
jgi:signal transduction histidine kinase